MSKLDFATIDDDLDLKKLLSQNPMDSWVNISLEREPSYFDGVSLMGDTYTLVSRENSNLVGMYSLTSMNVHMNGTSQRVSYLAELRVQKIFRHKIRLLKEGFDSIKKLLPKDSTKEFFFTSIATQNHKARRLLEANIKGMPRYEKQGQMSTLVFSNKISKNHNLFKKANSKDIDDIVSFYNKQASKYQFSPCLSKEWLKNLDGKKALTIDDFYIARDHNKELMACAALWDQRAFKQSVIKGYRSPLKYLRVIYNIYANFTKRVTLPKKDQRIESVFISFFAYNDHNTAIKALYELSDLSKNINKVDSCILGVSSQNTILGLIKKEFKPSIYLTEIETVTLSSEDLATDMLDDLIVQPEVALL